MKKRPEATIDGWPHTQEEEAKLNAMALDLFKAGAGKAFLDYLRSITINAVTPPGYDPNSLIHLEGQRFLVGLIDRRIAKGRKERANG